MPRYRTRTLPGPSDAPVEFDLCARCASDGDIVRTIVKEKLKVPATSLDGSLVEQVPHRSYDFQPRPTPCLSCARILSSEDD